MMIEQIREKLISKFSPTHLEIHNDSHLHRGPQNAETHFRVFIVCKDFDGLNAVKRQRLVYDCLSVELKTGVHALSLKTMSPNELNETHAQAQSAMQCAHKKI
jgi:BolA family transcriptional regulator, general stress-responsive regulator